MSIRINQIINVILSCAAFQLPHPTNGRSSNARAEKSGDMSNQCPIAPPAAPMSHAPPSVGNTKPSWIRSFSLPAPLRLWMNARSPPLAVEAAQNVPCAVGKSVCSCSRTDDVVLSVRLHLLAEIDRAQRIVRQAPERRDRVIEQRNLDERKLCKCAIADLL